MLINVKVIPNAKKDNMAKTAEGYKVHLTAPALDNKANKALVKFLSHAFHVSKSRITIIKGLHSREKKVNIEDL